MLSISDKIYYYINVKKTMDEMILAELVTTFLTKVGYNIAIIC